MGDTHHTTTTNNVVGNQVNDQGTVNIDSQVIGGGPASAIQVGVDVTAQRQAVAGLVQAVIAAPELWAREEVRRDMREAEEAAAATPVEVGRIRAVVARVERYPGLTTVVVGALQALQATLLG
jgi:hypothetical protein